MNVKRKLCASAGIVLVAVVAFVIAGSRHASAALPRPASVEVPKFAVDPSWPHIPNGWTLGQVSSVACDSDGNVWVFHRPRTVKPGVKTGPPVLEFDQAGNYIQGWGDKWVPAQPVDATPSDINLFSKGGVYDATETGEAFREPAGRHVEPLEGGTVVA